MASRNEEDLKGAEIGEQEKLICIYIYIYSIEYQYIVLIIIVYDRRKFRSQTSDNMDR